MFALPGQSLITRGGRRIAVGSVTFGPIVETPPEWTEDFSSYANGTVLYSGVTGFAAYSTTGTPTNVRDSVHVVGNKIAQKTSSPSIEFNPNNNWLIGRKAHPSNNNHWFEHQITTLGLRQVQVMGTDNMNRVALAMGGSGSDGGVYSVAKAVAGTGTSLVSKAFASINRFAGGPFERNMAINDRVRILRYGNSAAIYRNGRRFLNGSVIDVIGVPDNNICGVCTRDALYNDADGFKAGGLSGKIEITGTIQKVYPRIQGLGGFANGGASITFTGTYAGTAPTGLQWALLDGELGDATALVKDWARVSTPTIGGGTWSATVIVPCGANGTKPYAISFRAENDTNNYDSSYDVFYVAYTVLGYGQSNMNLARNGVGAVQPLHSGGFTYGAADSPSTANPGRVEMSNWRTTNIDPGTCQAFGHITKMLGDALAMPIYIIDIANGGLGADGLGPSGAVWANRIAHLTQAGGAFDAIMHFQGEQEINAAYFHSWTTETINTITGLRALSGQPPGTVIPVIYGLTGRYKDASPDGARNTRANALRPEQLLLATNLSDSYLGWHVSGVTMDGSGDVHFALTAGGYERMARRIALSLRNRLAEGAYDGRGPLATTLTRTSTNNFEIAVNLNGAASLSGSALTGYEISINGFSSSLTISSIGVSGGKVVIVTTGDDGTSQAQVRNYRGFDPADSSNALGTYPDGTTIELFPIIVPLAT